MNVSLDDVEPEVVLKADLLVVDDWKLIEHDDKRLLGRMFRAGQITAPNLGKQPEPGVRVVDSKADPNWRADFKPFKVTKALHDEVSTARTIFMHDLPAVRGEEVDSEILDGPQSIAFRQARFKLFSAMAILEWCILGGLSFAIDGAN